MKLPSVPHPVRRARDRRLWRELEIQRAIDRSRLAQRRPQDELESWRGTGRQP